MSPGGSDLETETLSMSEKGRSGNMFQVEGIACEDPMYFYFSFFPSSSARKFKDAQVVDLYVQHYPIFLFKTGSLCPPG